jgi:predicted phosphatase
MVTVVSKSVQILYTVTLSQIYVKIVIKDAPYVQLQIICLVRHVEIQHLLQI